MTAVSMPGTLASMPNFACPVTLARPSMRCTGRPMRVKSFGLFSFTSAGGARVAALAASCPNESLLAVPSWSTKPFSARQLAGSSTFHVSAAAATSMARAVAPALRSCSNDVLTLVLPPVT